MKHKTTTQPVHRLLKLGFNIQTVEDTSGPFLGPIPSNPR